MKRLICLVLSALMCFGCVSVAAIAETNALNTAEAINNEINRYLAYISMYNDCDNETVDGTAILSYRNTSALTMEMETQNVSQGSAAAKFIKRRANDDDMPMLFRTMDTLELSNYTNISFDVYVSENMTVLGTDSSAWANLRFQAEHVDSMDTGWIAHIDWPDKISNLKSGEWVTITLDIPADESGTFRQISIRPGNLCFAGTTGDYLIVDNVRLTPKEQAILDWDCSDVDSEILELNAAYLSLGEEEKSKVTHADYLTAWAQTAMELREPQVLELINKIDSLAAQFGIGNMFNDCENKTSGGTELIANTNSGAWSFEMVTDKVSQGTTAAKYAKKSSSDADLPIIVRNDNNFTTTDYKSVNFDLYVSEGMTVSGTSSTAWAIMKLQSAWDNSSDAGAVCEASFKDKIAGLKAGQWNSVSIPLPETMNTMSFKQICIRIGYECLNGAAGEYVIIDNVFLSYSNKKAGSFAVGSGKEDEIKAMKATFDDLTDAQKAAVTNADLLNCWLTAIAEAEATLASEVIALIDAIGTVHIFSDNDIALARATYNKLSDVKKEDVTNYQKLVDAEAALAEMEHSGNYVVPQDMQAKPAANASGTTVSTCDNSNRATVTGANKVVYPTVKGETFVAFTATAGELIQLRDLSLTSNPVNISGKNKDDLSLRMAIYVSNGKGLRSGGQFEITSGGGPDKNEYHWMTETVTLQDGWNVLYLDLKDAQATGGELNLSAINYLRFYFYCNEDAIIAFDDIALVDRVVPQFDEDFADGSAVEKWQSEAEVSIVNQALQVKGSDIISVQTSAYNMAISQPAYTPIEFDLTIASPEAVTAVTFILTDKNGKKATLQLDPHQLSAGKATHYMVVPIDMTCDAGFAFDLATSAMLSVASQGQNTLTLDNVTTNVRSGIYWRDWVYNYTATPGEYSIAVIPDIQELTAIYPQKLNTIMQWMVDHKQEENLQFVIDVGDLTWNGHSGSRTEFATAADAFKKLQDAGIEYGIAYGNHDYQTGRDTSLLNEYFPLSNMSTFDSFGGVMTDGKIDNMYQCFEVQGNKYMVVSLEFDPLPDTITWANQVIAQHKDYQVIINTHNYMNDVYGQYSYAGENLWPNLVTKHENIIMVICGHDCLADDPGSLSYRSDKGDNGNTVHQLMVNSQDIDASRGGVGLLLMMRFRDGGKTVDLNYFSPVNDDLAYKPQNQFTIALDEGSQPVAPTDEEIAQEVIDQIDALNVQSLSDEAAVVAARTAYDDLTDGQKELVSNLAKLQDAEAEIARLKADAEANQAAAQAVIDKIAALPETVTMNDKAAVVAARQAYDDLTDTQKTLVTNLDKLLAAEAQLVPQPPVEILYGDVDNNGKVEAADALEVLKSVVGKVTLTDDQLAVADTDGNDKADAADALNILKKVVGKIDKFPVEEA